MNSFQMNIGGIPISIRSEQSQFMQLIAEKYQAFASSPDLKSKENSLIITHSGCQHIQLYMDIGHEKGSGQKDELSEEKLWVDVTFQNNRFLIRRPDLEGEIDLVNRVAKVSNREAIYSFDSFLRICYSLILVQESGFLLHAASVVRDGQGYVFMGRSGSGKSTIAAYSSQYLVLSDEISLVRKIGSHYFIYSTPFWGEQEIKGENFYAPLQGIYQLKKGLQPLSKKLPRRDSLVRLMENTLFFSREPFLTKQLFQNCFDFIQNVTVYELEFQKHKFFWDVINRS